MGRHPLNFEIQCKRILKEAMQITQGNKKAAACILGLSRQTIDNWIAKYRLRDEFKQTYAKDLGL